MIPNKHSEFSCFFATCVLAILFNATSAKPDDVKSIYTATVRHTGFQDMELEAVLKSLPDLLIKDAFIPEVKGIAFSDQHLKNTRVTINLTKDMPLLPFLHLLSRLTYTDIRIIENIITVEKPNQIKAVHVDLSGPFARKLALKPNITEAELSNALVSVGIYESLDSVEVPGNGEFLVIRLPHDGAQLLEFVKMVYERGFTISREK